MYIFIYIYVQTCSVGVNTDELITASTWSPAAAR